jgi:DNA-binding transcriptional ArsR family regulator
MVEHRQVDLDRVYGALSHPSRREMLEQLATAPARITDLADRFDISFAGVSKHVHVLEDAGLLRREVQGREHRLSLEALPLASASSWLATYRRFWEQRLDLLDRRIRESRRK